MEKKPAQSSTVGKDGKVFKTFRLRPETVESLGQVATKAGTSPSSIVDALVTKLVEHGPDRINWASMKLGANTD
jgi:hypothetical protein